MILFVTKRAGAAGGEKAERGAASMMPRAPPRKAVYGANMMLA
jgi:hypothetical protein